ncbi:MAG TPA: Asp-tRNA(Asn)/Glu-tRNA(Gln) amidotransferase subunit GatC [Vicinamibacteria bacterium]|nr:Asp-tRNA(Asn)/Glu-tRNA(Gln) amidotransferase subunit GatC [Vicinamibacteria bacterium]
MPKVTLDLVRKLAALSHLSLTDEECAGFTQDLERILEYAESLHSLDTEGIEPTSHALLEKGLEGEARLRADEPRPGLDRERLLEGAPDGGDGLFKVPRVLP